MEDSVISLQLELLPNEILLLILEHLMPIDLIQWLNYEIDQIGVFWDFLWHNFLFAWTVESSWFWNVSQSPLDLQQLKNLKSINLILKN